ncbi:MAG TPA: prepilin-type N-terminal cleavage/methylation domain-containing protein [Kofleriaceae bacterium]|nr:prepilin-type N-terminal cleavage/methylation domain-containing protein [Kofleriaceae bacterium]
MRRGERGFTLLELLITLSVTTIGLVGLLALHLSIARGNDGASRSADAQQLAASEIEALRALPIAGTNSLMTALSGSPLLALPTPQRTRTAIGRTGMSFTIKTKATAIVGASSSLIKIRTEVSWTEDGGTAGANNGQLDHMLPLEIIRTVEEAL